MSHSCSFILQGSNGVVTPPPDGGVSTGNPFEPTTNAVIVNFNNGVHTIDSTGSTGLKVRGVVKRNDQVIETTPAEENTSANQIPFTVELQNGDRLCVQVSNDDFATYDEDCITIPTPAFTFMDACPIILIEEILISGETVINQDGQETPLTTNIIPTDAAIQTLIWTSSDPSIATVNQQGIVTPRNDGTVTIYANANDGSGVVGEHILTISNQIPNNILIDDSAPSGDMMIQYDDLIGLEETQIEFNRDGMIESTSNYDLDSTTGTITLTTQGDIFEGETIIIFLI